MWPAALEHVIRLQTPGNAWGVTIRNTPAQHTLLVSDTSGGVRLYGYNHDL